MDWRERITVDALIAHGRACIKGIRVMVSVILDNLAAGQTTSQIRTNFPPLTLEDIQAGLAYGSELAKERIAFTQDVGSA